ncbi:restriction endonuclease fold toxin-2 domain-containing protein [Streptomyces sp. NPDC096032]|uniref:restriction endonuclease fold toxin-2 domain-containing protein n=1 Tax=Streptomyces sp. NPDC096032 TaxID=3366070 RepID=UPI0037F1830D
MVDGFRNLDGMAVEAKYVNKPNQQCCRSLEGRREYAAALNDPRNKEMRGVETVTNNQDAVQDWRIMMAAYGVEGHACYVP